MAPGKLGHEGDARLLHPAFDRLGLAGVEFQADGAIDGLARLARRQDRQFPEPLGRKHQHGVDVFPLDEHVVAIDRVGMELGGRLLGPMPHRVADRPDLEPVGQRPQRRGVPRLPDIAQSDQASTEPHGCIASSGFNALTIFTFDYIDVGSDALNRFGVEVLDLPGVVATVGVAPSFPVPPSFPNCDTVIWPT